MSTNLSMQTQHRHYLWSGLMQIIPLINKSQSRRTSLVTLLRASCRQLQAEIKACINNTKRILQLRPRRSVRQHIVVTARQRMGAETLSREQSDKRASSEVKPEAVLSLRGHQHFASFECEHLNFLCLFAMTEMILSGCFTS